MHVRKMAGWCLLLVGVAKVFQGIYLEAEMGHSMDVFHAVAASLLLTVGVAVLWLGRAPWHHGSM
jgi:hypothetical protein